MFARQRGHDHIEFFQSDNAIRFIGLRDVAYQIEEQFDRRIIRQSEYFIEHVTRPVFIQHLFFSDENHPAAFGLAFAHEVAALEKGGETDDVEWFCGHV